MGLALIGIFSITPLLAQEKQQLYKPIMLTNSERSDQKELNKELADILTLNSAQMTQKDAIDLMQKLLDSPVAQKLNLPAGATANRPSSSQFVLETMNYCPAWNENDHDHYVLHFNYFHEGVEVNDAYLFIEMRDNKKGQLVYSRMNGKTPNIELKISAPNLQVLEKEILEKTAQNLAIHYYVEKNPFRESEEQSPPTARPLWTLDDHRNWKLVYIVEGYYLEMTDQEIRPHAIIVDGQTAEILNFVMMAKIDGGEEPELKRRPQ